MGLLMQALGGALEQGGNTAAAMMIQNQQNNFLTERDKAQALREENLTRLRQSLMDQSAEKTHGRALSAAYDPDTNRQLTNDEAADYEPDSLIGAHQAQQNATINPNFTVNGRPATNQQISDNADANENVGMIRAAQQKRSQEAINGVDFHDMKAIQEAKKRGEATPEEQEILDSWKGDSGKVANVKEDAAQQKAETQVALMQMKVDNAAALAQMKWDSAKELLQAKVAAGHTAESAEYKKTLAEIKKAEEQRKAADSAAKLLDKTGGDMTPDQTKLYNSFLTMAGTEEDVKPVPAAKVKKESKGLLGMVMDKFGGSKAPAASTAGPTVMVYKNGKLQPK